ncbi:MAG: mechanosensitive ion channel [Bacteroidia bacterium]|nr:mechanosensitive ion channel [Bacteroidia bacterium]NNJ54784.1 mechanosensitive ion channel [Bacteroidia bacterium]
MKDFLEYEILNFGDDAILKVSSILYIFIASIVIYIIYRWIKKLIRSAVKAGRIDAGRAYAISQMSKYILVVFLLFLTLLALQVNWKIFYVLGPLLIGFGLGIQQVFNDLVSGIILLIEPSIRVNDIVEVDNIVAQVKEIGLRTSKVESREGIAMIIPNHKLVSEKLINWSSNDPVTRFSIEVGVAYGSDVQLVKKLLIEVAWKHSKVITNPEPIVFFRDFGDSSLNFELVFWSNHLFQIEIVKSDLRYLIDEAFRENNVTIPFPQRDLHVKSGNL